MNRVYNTDEKSLDEILFVAIAIGEVDDGQRHTGLLHRDGGRIDMLHLKWHHKLRNESPPKDFLWVSPAGHPKRLAQVADICRLVWRANQRAGVPFGFSPPTDCFDPNTGRF